MSTDRMATYEQSDSQFTTSRDGTPIAYRVYGEGSPTVLLSNGIGCNQVFLEHLIRDLQAHYRCVIWDYRGHVDSAKPTDPRAVTIDHCMQDLLAVQEAAGIETAVLGGFSIGVQVSLEFLSRWPDRVLGLLALLGPYQFPLRSFFHLGPLAELAFRRLLKRARRHPRLAQKLWTTALSGPWVYPAAKLAVLNRRVDVRADFSRYRPHIAHIDALTFLEMAASASVHSAAHVLPKVRVPTLVVAGDQDNFSPVKVCRRMQREIPGAEWFLVEGGSHGALLEFPRQINQRVLAFMREHYR